MSLESVEFGRKNINPKSKIQNPKSVVGLHFAL
jgi:hypothetical protein